MNASLIDLQLKQLTQLCLATHNYDKLGSVLITLISNRLDEIGVQLGIKPRAKGDNKEERMAQYMDMINNLLYSNFGLTLFCAALIEKIRYNEVIMLRRRNPLDYSQIQVIRTLIHAYYELRKLEVPNVYETFSPHELFQIPSEKMFSFLSNGKPKKKASMGGITPLILQKIQDHERTAERQLQSHYDPELFERTLQLKAIRKSFQTQNQQSGKIILEGALKENINYLRAKERLIQYLLLGWIVLFCMLGAVILTQTILYPATAFGVSPYLLLIFGSSAVLILLYRYYNHLGGGLSL